MYVPWDEPAVTAAGLAFGIICALLGMILGMAFGVLLQYKEYHRLRNRVESPTPYSS